jgi:hypothetical protein
VREIDARMREFDAWRGVSAHREVCIKKYFAGGTFLGQGDRTGGLRERDAGIGRGWRVNPASIVGKVRGFGAWSFGPDAYPTRNEGYFAEFGAVCVVAQSGAGLT